MILSMFLPDATYFSKDVFKADNLNKRAMRALDRSPELCNEINNAKHMTKSQTTEINKRAMRPWNHSPENGLFKT